MRNKNIRTSKTFIHHQSTDLDKNCSGKLQKWSLSLAQRLASRWQQHLRKVKNKIKRSMFSGKPKATIIQRDNHCISRKNINVNALKVLHRLNNHGYEAYIVGGCIRDLMLGLKPKDFDITTNATPEQVRKLFRNSRIIGRRFKLIHVVFGRDVVEVATFRANHQPDIGVNNSHSKTGRILRDNVYGSVEEDAARRDFTINALYYTTTDFTIHDFCLGLDHIKNRIIRLIGEPYQRYREDPVRMLRAIRFAAKLHFIIEDNTADPIFELAHLLEDIPPARLFDETLKLFQTGHGVTSFHLLVKYKLLESILPVTFDSLYYEPEFERFIINTLENTDNRVKQGKSTTPAFLFAALLWEAMLQLKEDLIEHEDMDSTAAQQKAVTTILSEQCKITAIPNKITAVIREIWSLQHSLEKINHKKIEVIMGHPRFRAAYDFLLLREKSGEQLDGASAWWTKCQKNKLLE